MRVLMLNNEFPPLGGGTGVFNQHVLREWAACEDVEVDLVTSDGSRRRLEVQEFTRRIHLHKLPLQNKNIHHSSNHELLNYAWRGWRYARKLALYRQYDICLAWAGVPAGGMALWLYREMGLPYVVSLQGADVPGFDRRYRALYPLLTPFIRQVWRHAARLAACSQQLTELAHQMEPGIAIEFIPHGVDTSTFHPSDKESANPGHTRVICSSRLIERKGQQYLIPSVAELKKRGLDVELILVGAGDNELPLRRMTRELGLEEVVRFVGATAREGMPALYRESDLFALPSFSEGMSLALLEAMASGLPVVITDTGGARELLHDNGLVVSWANVPELTSALATMIAQPDLRRTMARNSRLIAERYSSQRSAHAYLKLCQEAACGGRPRG